MHGDLKWDLILETDSISLAVMKKFREEFELVLRCKMSRQI